MKIIREFEQVLAARLTKKTKFIQAVVGPRQVGKTTGIKNLLSTWSGAKVFESADSLEPLTTDWLAAHWQRAAALGDGTLLVIDEIQKIPNWSAAVKKLYDDTMEVGLKIVLLGSASFKIQKGLRDSLAGRYELIKVPHWNFFEMHAGFNFTFEDYLSYGGYPGAAEFIKDPFRWQEYVRNSIIENVLSKDLVDVAEIRNPALLRQLFFLAMGLPAQEISFQKLVGQLQDRGALATVKSYLELLESAHLLKLLYKYSERDLTTRTSSPKLLPLAPALISAINDPLKPSQDTKWRGRIFEAAVGAALYSIAEELYYWREGKLEVDYVVKIKDRLLAIEVKSGTTGKLSGLSHFTKQYKNSVPLLIDWEKGQKLLNFKNLQELRENPNMLLNL